ncbi:MAG: 16S rRNA (guanine(527)-N(7))-methyltransferase RsmG [Desulfovibrio sp.]|nr:16S rRNA (guanine(527)-N(7))-methyltransferase RsmG [Desulfovibrio sp.]
MDTKKVQSLLKTFGFDINDTETALITTYLNMVLKWNKAINLTGYQTAEEILQFLVTDSLYVARFLKTLNLPTPLQTLDVGAGAGFPGIPLRIVWHQGLYTLIERREKRALFLANVLANLNLPETLLFRGSVENIAVQADLIISKAFLPWQKLLPFIRPLLKQESILIVLTTQACPNLASWTLCHEMHYTLEQKQRFLWAISPRS